MSPPTPAPRPGPSARLDPAAVLAEVDVVLDRAVGTPADEAIELDAVHRRLAQALATIDRV